MLPPLLSNMGLHAYADKNGMKIECSNVGDRYVLEMMLKKGYILGGEQSGHVIFLEYASTGDGELTALQFMSILKASGKKCSEIAAEVEPWPQLMINVKVPTIKRLPCSSCPRSRRLSMRLLRSWAITAESWFVRPARRRLCASW